MTDHRVSAYRDALDRPCSCFDVRVRHTCPECRAVHWVQAPGGLRSTPGADHLCPICAARRAYAALPWWRRLLTRITRKARS